MKNLIILILGVAVIAFGLSFGSGLGYAKGGGSIELLPRTVTASSETGQAVAVWGDIENFNASNTPLPVTKTVPPRTFWDALPMLALLVAVGGFLYLFISHLKPDDYDAEWQPDPDIQPHHSSKEAAENARKYGPQEAA